MRVKQLIKWDVKKVSNKLLHFHMTKCPNFFNAQQHIWNLAEQSMYMKVHNYKYKIYSSATPDITGNVCYVHGDSRRDINRIIEVSTTYPQLVLRAVTAVNFYNRMCHKLAQQRQGGA